MLHQTEMVELFHRLAGHPIGTVVDTLSPERAASRADWMNEEIQEFLEATNKNDVAGALDAIGDLLYFALGTAVEMGATNKIAPIFSAIHKANLTKFPVTIAEADRTVADYATKGIATHYHKVEFWPYTYYVVYFSEGPKAGKVAKFVDWQEPDFTGIL